MEFPDAILGYDNAPGEATASVGKSGEAEPVAQAEMPFEIVTRTDVPSSLAHGSIRKRRDFPYTCGTPSECL